MRRGEYTVLREAGMEDAEIMTSWQNDKEIMDYLHFVYPVSKGQQEDYITNVKCSKNDALFMVENEENVPIGLCKLKDINWINGTAGIEIVICAKNCWGRGYGYDALKTLTEYALMQLNLCTLYANITEKNEKAVKCFQKAGYKIEGVLYNRTFAHGEMKNVISMSISKKMQTDGE
ncbi:MAG: GNAT family N-acetyltransferase [Clostridiales bacterium]|nr:GNAT family N-acetyltransferase [Clostridiales bacterium]HBM80724.1 hypothetical protein [Clostridiaceae bacterium]